MKSPGKIVKSAVAELGSAATGKNAGDALKRSLSPTSPGRNGKRIKVATEDVDVSSGNAKASSSSSTPAPKKQSTLSSFLLPKAPPALPLSLPSTTSTSSSTLAPTPPADTTAAGATAHASIAKSAFAKTLDEEGRKLFKMELEYMGDDWFSALQKEFSKQYFRELKKFVVQEQTKGPVYPPAKDVYSWSRLCPLKGVRVVIIGQDPYHDIGQAHGLAFSVKKPTKIPPSLRNMYKELGDEYPDFGKPAHGDLTKWAEQGVLLLNTSLTVRAHQAGSHSKKGWDTFTTTVLRTVLARLAPTGEEAGGKGVVVMAWGAHAGKLCDGINGKDNLILKSAHPSPLSASRGFLGNGHFKKANEWLVGRYGEEGGIDWRID